MIHTVYKLTTQLIAYLQLSRVSMAPLTMSVPVLGALTQVEKLGSGQLWGLALLGLCAHFFGFVLNDLMDRKVDRTSPSRRNSPLVTGRIAVWQAWLFALVQIPAAVSFYVFGLTDSRTGLGFLWLSIGLSLAYNLWSKWGPMPRFVAELALALSIGALCLAGGLSATTSLSWAGIIFTATLVLVLLLLNSVPSGLKDLKTDYEFQARSFVIAAGCRMLSADKISISRTIRVYSGTLQLLILGGFLLLIQLFQFSWFSSLPVVILWLYAGLHLRMVFRLTSFAALRKSMPMLSGYYNFFALALFGVKAMPLYLQLGYGLSLLALLATPWYLGVYIWRRRYQFLINDSKKLDNSLF